MPIDESMESGNDASAQSVSESGSTASATADQQSSSPNERIAAETTDAQPNPAAAPAAGSLANPNAIPQNAQKGLQQAPANAQPQPLTAADWQKRMSGMQSALQSKIDKIEQARRQEQGELTQLREFQQQQRLQAEATKLKQWSKQHPDNGKFQSLLQRAQTVRQQIQSIDGMKPPEGLSPEQQMAWRDSMKAGVASVLAPEEEQQLMAYHQEMQSFQRDFFADPRGTMSSMFRDEIQQAFQQYAVHQQAQAAVDRDFSEMDSVIQTHGAELKQLLDRRVPYDVAVENVKLKAQLGSLQNRVGEAERTSGAAQEQQRLAKSTASITRDPAPVGKPDILALAKKEAAKRDIKTDDVRFMGIVSSIEQKFK